MKSDVVELVSMVGSESIFFSWSATGLEILMDSKSAQLDE